MKKISILIVTSLIFLSLFISCSENGEEANSVTDSILPEEFIETGEDYSVEASFQIILEDVQNANFPQNWDGKKPSGNYTPVVLSKETYDLLMEHLNDYRKSRQSQKP